MRIEKINHKKDWALSKLNSKEFKNNPVISANSVGEAVEKIIALYIFDEEMPSLFDLLEEIKIEGNLSIAQITKVYGNMYYLVEYEKSVKVNEEDNYSKKLYDEELLEEMGFFPGYSFF